MSTIREAVKNLKKQIRMKNSYANWMVLAATCTLCEHFRGSTHLNGVWSDQQRWNRRLHVERQTTEPREIRYGFFMSFSNSYALRRRNQWISICNCKYTITRFTATLKFCYFFHEINELYGHLSVTCVRECFDRKRFVANRIENCVWFIQKRKWKQTVIITATWDF